MARELEGPKDDNDDWIGTGEAAEITGLSQYTVQNLCRRGILVAVRDRSTWRVSRQGAIEYKTRVYRVTELDPLEIIALYKRHGSLQRASAAAKMSPETFRDRLIKAGGRPYGRGVNRSALISRAIARVYHRLEIDHCPPDCPGWMRDHDCLTADRCLLAELIEKGEC